MILVKCQTKDYSADKVKKAYVRLSLDNKWIFCETGFINSYDIRQGEVSQDLIPLDIQEKAKSLTGTWPSYVEINKEVLQ